MTPRLELKGITKAFSGVSANEQIDLVIQPGEIHALLGENGAGKSTLVKVVNGVHRRDAGHILWEGREVDIAGPQAARQLGIGMVFQHFSLFEALTVTENIALGLPAGGPSGAALSERIAGVGEAYGLHINPLAHAHSLSVGERQRVEIIRCLLQEPKLLIMDEPTSVLTPQEVTNLFATLRRLAGEGCSILYISHKLHEIKALCERATILRNGRVVADCVPANESAASLAQMMVGQVVTPARRAASASSSKPALLDVRDLCIPAATPFAVPLADVSLQVAPGELFGIAGVAGNGQVELCEALYGQRLAPRNTDIRIDGHPVGHSGVLERRLLGLTYVAEDRLGTASVPSLSLAENAFLSAYQRKAMLVKGFVRKRVRDTFARLICADYSVKGAGIDAPAKSLSGGNLQKFITGREILQAPRVLIAAQPTWGLDAGAAADIHRALMTLAHDGCAVLVISQELEELFAICDRLAVMTGGRLSPAKATESVSVTEIGLALGAAQASIGDPTVTAEGDHAS